MRQPERSRPSVRRTALAMCGDGVSRGLGDAAIGMQRVRHKLPELQPYSVQEMLRLLEKHVHEVDARGAGDEEAAPPASAHGLVFRAEVGAGTAALDPFADEYGLARGPHLEQLPASVNGYRFVLGACLREAPEDMDGVRFPSYYALTRVAAEAVVGVHVPEGMTHYSPFKPRRVSRNVARYVPLPRSRQLETEMGEGDDDAAFALGDSDTTAAVDDEEGAALRRSRPHVEPQESTTTQDKAIAA